MNSTFDIVCFLYVYVFCCFIMHNTESVGRDDVTRVHKPTDVAFFRSDGNKHRTSRVKRCCSAKHKTFVKTVVFKAASRSKNTYNWFVILSVTESGPVGLKINTIHKLQQKDVFITKVDLDAGILASQGRLLCSANLWQIVSAKVRELD